MRAVVLLALVWIWPALAAAAQQPAAAPDGIDLLVAAIQRSVQAGDPLALRALARLDTDTGQLRDFVNAMTSPAPSGATIKERDRALLTSGRERLMLEILTEHAREGRVSTWRVDVAPPQPPAQTGPDAPWQIASVQRLTVVGGLHRLQLDATTEYDVRNLTVDAIDLKLFLPSGRAFIAHSADGPTAVVLLGRGRVQFSPRLKAERVQIHIFCGQDSLNTEFDAVFLRLNPGEFNQRIPPDSLAKREPHQGDLRRATQIFEPYAPLSFQIDLSDLSTQRWSLVPSATDFVAEIVTRRYGPLTYARSSNDPEDVSFFDRRRHRNISVYASTQTDERERHFFSEDDGLDFDITSYDIRATFSPDRLWVDGRARLRIRTRAPMLATMTLHLAEPLVVRSITSREFGRLLHLRIVGQNSILISLPAGVPSDTELELTVIYGGRLAPQTVDREAIAVQQGAASVQLEREEARMPLEAHFVYSNRSYWYPQATVTDYATAVLTIVVPAEFDAVASGTPRGEPSFVDPLTPGQRPAKQYVFDTTRPARYLACVISRFHGLEPARLNLPTAPVRRTQPTSGEPRAADDGDDADRWPVSVFVETNPREFGRAKNFADRTTDILTFYASLLGDAPYNSFTLAITESDLPGGHSPAYFAILDQPLPSSPLVWRNDPVAFENYPSFFLAHEVAHQWWGQAVGWKNYHEQWLSEGFAQYFAALYAERERGAEQFTSVIRQMRRWAIEMSPQGPVYLGYRLGHIKGDTRVFRAVVYNKGAMVLHMLRRFVGDRAFFAGLREFYAAERFRKAGTDDFQAAMEAACGKSLQRFFDRWIFESDIPTVRFSMPDTTSAEVLVRFEQLDDRLFDIPITVTLSYADGSSEDVVVAVTDKVIERRLPLKRALRSVDVNRDGGALAEIER
jgi:hypothetical protein